MARLRLPASVLILLLAFPVSSVTSGRLTPGSAANPRRGFALVTLNTARNTDAATMVSQISAAPPLRHADVILLQEVAHAYGHTGSVADEIAAEFKMNVAYAPAAPDINDQGLAILSRYPLRDIHIVRLRRYHLGWHSRNRFALSATVVTPAGNVRISNAHLDTRVNAGERIRQLDDALEEDAGDGARVVAGDFNTNNFYWLGHALPFPVPQIQTGAVRRLMEKRGYLSALPASTATFDELGMQLDWVFSRGLRAHDSEVIPMRFSDHHAVWVELDADLPLKP